MRSFASDLSMIDEGREFTLETGHEFERAIFPTQATGRGGQFQLWSNAGTATSTWLRKWRDIGRASITDPASDIAYLEYAAPDDADISDPRVWAANHPGLGHHVLIDALAADYLSLEPDDFAAEYLGLWPETQIDARLLAGWLAATADVEVSLGDPVVFGLEVSADRSRVLVAAVGTAADGGPAAALILEAELAPGWVALLTDELARWRPSSIVFDAAGPVRALRPELEALPINVAELGTRDVIAAAGAFYDRVCVAALGHGDDPRLEAAVTAARQRAAGGAWLFDRRASAALPVLAVAAALWRWLDGRQRPPTVS